MDLHPTFHATVRAAGATDSGPPARVAGQRGDFESTIPCPPTSSVPPAPVLEHEVYSGDLAAHLSSTVTTDTKVSPCPCS